MVAEIKVPFAENTQPSEVSPVRVGQNTAWRALYHHHHHHHQFLNREGRWGTIDDFATSFLHFSLVLHCPLGLAELQACPFPDVVFPPLVLSF